MALKYTVTLWGMRGGKRSLISAESFDNRLKLRVLNFLAGKKLSPGRDRRFAYTSDEIQQSIGQSSIDPTDFEMILYDMEQDELIQPISRSEVPEQLLQPGQETIKDPRGIQYALQKLRGEGGLSE